MRVQPGSGGGGGGGSSGVTRTSQTVNPLATGQTTVIPEGTGVPRTHLLWGVPTATIAAWTIQLPSDAGSLLGDRIAMGAAKNVTSLSFAAGPTIYNPLTTLNGGDLFIIEKIAANTWAHEI